MFSAATRFTQGLVFTLNEFITLEELLISLTMVFLRCKAGIG